MKTISLQISNKEFNSLGLAKKQMRYSELKKFVEQQIANEAIKTTLDYDCANIAKNNNLRLLTQSEIDTAINVMRKRKKMKKCD
jgi:hypothetical protein